MNISFALLVPCYNAENYIDGFLQNLSALNKHFDEVIFYDDASTDNTYQSIKEKGYNIVKGGQNRGPGYARNQLVQISESDWVHFHDIDDGLHPDYLVKTSAIAKKGVADVVLCNVNWFDAQTNDICLCWEYSNNQINNNPIAYTISHPIGGINGLYRKAKFKETGGFNTQLRIWEDADIHVKLAAKRAVFYIVEEVLSYSVRYAQSASADQGLGWLTRINLLWEYYESFHNIPDRKEIGRQAQIAASRLIMCGQFSAAKNAFQLSELCKVKVPENNSKIWKYLKKTVPASARINLRLWQLKIAFHKKTDERSKR